MNNKALKVLCTLATGTALATSMQVIAIADSTQISNSSYSSIVTGIVTANVLNIRSNPNTSSSVIGKLNYNTKVSIIEISNGWYKVNYNNTTGWISGQYVNLYNNSTGQASTIGVVTADALNVRSGASTSTSIIGSLNESAMVQIISTSNGWHKIKFNNTTGFVSAEYINTSSGNLDSGNSYSSTEDTVISTGIVNADALNVRSGASTNNSIIGSLNESAMVQIISTSNGWHKIKFNNTTGFVSAEYITLSSTNDNSENNNSNSDNDNSPNENTVISTGIVNADALNVRSGASTSNSIIGSLNENAMVQIISTNNGWHKIKFNGGTGFVSAEFISDGTGTVIPPAIAVPSHTVDGKVAIINADALNVRSGASTSYSVVTTVRYGSKLPIISYTNGWYKVNVGSTTGYISGDYATIIDETHSSNPVVKETPIIQSDYTGEDIVAKTEEYLGVPYLWGGFTPMGFDCSGLVQYVYKQLGISLERTTYYQVHQGVIVDRNDLKPGDLIFFTTNDDDPNDISHVGIYKGNDLFIQSPKPGDYVRVSNLNSAYYSNRYYVAKRIIK